MRSGLPIGTLIVAVAIAAVGCALPQGHNLPPAQQLLEPGPGVGGPGPGVLPPVTPGIASPAQMISPLDGSAGGSVGCNPNGSGMGVTMGMGGAMTPPTAQVLFSRPEGLQIRWDVSGIRMFDSEPLIIPGRYNFRLAMLVTFNQ